MAIRARGFCQADMMPEKVWPKGFLKEKIGQLSPATRTKALAEYQRIFRNTWDGEAETEPLHRLENLARRKANLWLLEKVEQEMMKKRSRRVDR